MPRFGSLAKGARRNHTLMPKANRIARLIVLASLLSFHPRFCIGAWSASPTPLRVESFPIRLDPEDADREEFDGLCFLSGFELSSGDSRFGGLSGLELSSDGGRLYAVSDHGYWFSARLSHDAQGRLRGVGSWKIAPLLTPRGTAVSRRLRDAESLVRDRDGSLVVAFERVHRLWRYPPPPKAFTSRPRPIPHPPGVEKAPANGGLEAVAVLSDGSLLLLTEKYENPDGSLKGWILRRNRFFPLSYLQSDGFRPTDLATLANGDLLLLERRYSWLRSAAVRLRRIAGKHVRPGMRIKGSEIALLEPPLEVDNFEGLAVHEDPGRGILVYMISDDNYSPLQRTLLLQFRLASPGT